MKKQMNRCQFVMMGVALGIVCGLFSASCSAADAQESAPPELTSALMCETVQDGLPVDETIIFNITNGYAYCWSEFDPVSEDGVIYHNWYRRGELISRKKLAVHAPRWATYSRLPLRQADIAPWRLVITDENEKILKTIRFSVTE